MLCVIRRPIRWLMAVVSLLIATISILAASRVGFGVPLVLIFAFCF
jgi:hypothetical protein